MTAHMFISRFTGAVYNGTYLPYIGVRLYYNASGEPCSEAKGAGEEDQETQAHKALFGNVFENVHSWTGNFKIGALSVHLLVTFGSDFT